QFLDTNGRDHVVRARRHRVARVAEGLGAGGAHVLEATDRLVVDLHRPRQGESADARAHRAEPERVDVVELDAGRVEGGGGRVDDQLVDALVPVLAEGRAAHSDDRYAVSYPVTRHQVVSPRMGRAFQK